MSGKQVAKGTTTIDFQDEVLSIILRRRPELKGKSIGEIQNILAGEVDAHPARVSRAPAHRRQGPALKKDG